MGISHHMANAIINSHKNQAIRGKVLSCGRQSVFLTPEQTAELIRSHDLVPQVAIEECELDHETKIGGEGQLRRSGGFITDKSFFRMLGVESMEFLDHSDYEGAQTIVDLNEPIPPALESSYDFIIDGGTLDNVFNPPQALMNLSRMLKPGGRLLAYKGYSIPFPLFSDEASESGKLHPTPSLDQVSGWELQRELVRRYRKQIGSLLGFRRQ